MPRSPPHAESKEESKASPDREPVSPFPVDPLVDEVLRLLALEDETQRYLAQWDVAAARSLLGAAGVIPERPVAKAGFVRSHVFISHRGALKDGRGRGRGGGAKRLAARLSEGLGALGIVAFFDAEMLEGEYWRPVLEHALWTCEGAVVLLTKGYWESRWCVLELAVLLYRRLRGELPLRLRVVTGWGAPDDTVQLSDPECRHLFLGLLQGVDLLDKATYLAGAVVGADGAAELGEGAAVYGAIAPRVYELLHKRKCPESALRLAQLRPDALLGASQWQLFHRGREDDHGAAHKALVEELGRVPWRVPCADDLDEGLQWQHHVVPLDQFCAAHANAVLAALGSVVELPGVPATSVTFVPVRAPLTVLAAGRACSAKVATDLAAHFGDGLDCGSLVWSFDANDGPWAAERQHPDGFYVLHAAWRGEIERQPRPAVSYPRGSPVRVVVESDSPSDDVADVFWVPFLKLNRDRRRDGGGDDESDDGDDDGGGGDDSDEKRDDCDNNDNNDSNNNNHDSNNNDNNNHDNDNEDDPPHKRHDTPADGSLSLSVMAGLERRLQLGFRLFFSGANEDAVYVGVRTLEQRDEIARRADEVSAYLDAFGTKVTLCSTPPPGQSAGARNGRLDALRRLHRAMSRSPALSPTSHRRQREPQSASGSSDSLRSSSSSLRAALNRSDSHSSAGSSASVRSTLQPPAPADEDLVARGLHQRTAGDALLARGEHEAALARYEESLRAYTSVRGSDGGTAFAAALAGKGEALLGAGDPTAALEALNESADLHRAAGDRPSAVLARTLGVAARAHEARGDAASAARARDEANQILQELKL